jgi:hypothetical protein
MQRPMPITLSSKNNITPNHHQNLDVYSDIATEKSLKRKGMFISLDRRQFHEWIL